MLDLSKIHFIGRPVITFTSLNGARISIKMEIRVEHSNVKITSPFNLVYILSPGDMNTWDKGDDTAKNNLIKTVIATEFLRACNNCITAANSDKIIWPRIHASDIKTAVDNGIITLPADLKV